MSKSLYNSSTTAAFARSFVKGNGERREKKKKERLRKSPQSRSSLFSSSSSSSSSPFLPSEGRSIKTNFYFILFYFSFFFSLFLYFCIFMESRRKLLCLDGLLSTLEDSLPIFGWIICTYIYTVLSYIHILLFFFFFRFCGQRGTCLVFSSAACLLTV